LAGRRIKTDREDALNVAELLMTGRLPMAWAPPVNIQRVRNLTRHRVGLSRDHAKTLHRVKSIMNRLNRPGPARMDAAGLQRYLLASVERIAADDLMLLWQHERRPGHFSDAKAIGRYAGLRPTGHSSADKHRLSRICRTGSPDLRRALQQAAWAAMCCGPVFKIVAAKIGKSDKKKKAAAKAVATKLLVLIWALARRDELYRARQPIAA
jgi:transposase